jgi:hypothetical protein
MTRPPRLREFPRPQPTDESEPRLELGLIPGKETR